MCIGLKKPFPFAFKHGEVIGDKPFARNNQILNFYFLKSMHLPHKNG
jgi:hypothetical protein